jgi:hypothetical protein
MTGVSKDTDPALASNSEEVPPIARGCSIMIESKKKLSGRIVTSDLNGGFVDSTGKRRPLRFSKKLEKQLLAFLA